MTPEVRNQTCINPNFFSHVVNPAVNQRLPASGSLTGRAVDYLTNVRPFVETVSRDLCNDGRMSRESAKEAVGFITRSATTAIIGTASLGLTALGVVAGSPVAAIGVGVVALITLPPLVERAVLGAASLVGDIFQGIRSSKE